MENEWGELLRDYIEHTSTKFPEKGLGHRNPVRLVYSPWLTDFRVSKESLHNRSES